MKHWIWSGKSGINQILWRMVHVDSGGAGFMLYTMTITDKIKFEQSPTIPVHELVSIEHKNSVIWTATHIMLD